MTGWGRVATLPERETIEDAHDPLLQASRDGDIEAFARLYERYRPGLLGLCLRKLHDRQLAEDVIQETFLRAFAHLGKFQDGRRLWPWLAAIAERRCIHVLRRRSKTSVVEDVEAARSNRTIRIPEADSTLDAVIDAEERTRLARAVSQLPPRQRRALMLFAVEGWNYSDIASAEGTTLLSVKSLIFRARASLREACGAFGMILLPWRLFRRSGERVAERARRAAGTIHSLPEAAFTVGTNQFAAGIVAFAMMVSGVPWNGSETTARARDREDPALASSARLSSARDGEGTAAAAQRARGTAGGTSDLPTYTEDSLQRAGSKVYPGGNIKRPEDTHIEAVMFSPNFEDERTVFATANAEPCECPRILFHSTDGGATWLRLAARGLEETKQLLLPPNFAHGDPRIFAMGSLGLQVSEDGGATFRPAAPGAPVMQGTAAISPAFAAGDPYVLIGAQALTLYDDRLRAFTPATYIPITGPANPAYSPDYIRDGLLMIGGYRLGPPVRKQSRVFRCTASGCEEAPLADAFGSPYVRPAPDFARSGVAFAFSQNGFPYLSRDGARTFSRVAYPGGEPDPSGDQLSLWDVATMSDARVFAAMTGPEGTDAGLYVSENLGDGWRRVDSTVLQAGVMVLAASGRHVIAGLASKGLACSSDGGRTWAARCRSGT